MSRRGWLLVFSVIPLLAGGLSLHLGRDVNWDGRNYHYYNAHAYLTHRMDVDIAPAQLQTYFNPIGDLPFYLLVRNFPAWVAGFSLGFLHGLNLSLIFALYWQLSTLKQPNARLVIASCIVLVSAIAPGFLAELGNTMNDNLLSVLVLAALLLLLQSSRAFRGDHGRSGALLVAMAGLLIGAAVGVKLTAAVFAIGCAVAIAAARLSWKDRLVSLVVFGAAACLGALSTAGLWWWELWHRVGNPLFPFYNDIFQSAYFPPVAVDVRAFAPKDAWEFLTWPILFSLDAYRVSPLTFSDIRFALLYAVWLTLLIRAAVRRLRPPVRLDPSSTGLFDRSAGDQVLWFFGASFIVWNLQFSDYRYMIALELLVPFCFLLLLERLLRSRRLQAAVALGAAVLTLAVFKPYDWGRLEWTSSYFEVDLRRLPLDEKVMVVMLGGSPMAYVIPEMPAGYRFVRPEGNLLMTGTNQPLLDEVLGALREHDGPIYVLYDRDERGVVVEDSLRRLGLPGQTGECFRLGTNAGDHLRMCRVTPID